VSLQVNAIAEKYNGTGSMCTDLAEYNTLMRYLFIVVIFGHFQRPSVAANMTISEYMRAKTASDGRVIILVSEHKTGAQGPAQIALESVHYKLFALLRFGIFHMTFYLNLHIDLAFLLRPEPCLISLCEHKLYSPANAGILVILNFAKQSFGS